MVRAHEPGILVLGGRGRGAGEYALDCPDGGALVPGGALSRPSSPTTIVMVGSRTVTDDTTRCPVISRRGSAVTTTSRARRKSAAARPPGLSIRKFTTRTDPKRLILASSQSTRVPSSRERNIKARSTNHRCTQGRWKVMTARIATTSTGFFLGLLCSLFATNSCGSTLPPLINDENKPIIPCEPVK